MKTIVKAIIFTVLLILPFYCFSQYGFTKALDIDVKGIFIGGQYTKIQVQAKWGTPTKYWSMMTEFGLDEEYTYTTINKHDNTFRFGDDGRFHAFYVNNPNFVVYTAKSGGIKVGDNISRIAGIGLGTPVLQTTGAHNGAYYLFRPNIDDPIVFGHKNGVITWISYTMSI
jgi:hypothetical protein